MDAYRVPPEEAEEAMGKCSWCGKSLLDVTPVRGFCVKRPGVDMPEAGPIRVGLATQGRSVIGFVPTADSDARREGYDLLFWVCSKECVSEMKAALEEEISFGNALFGEIGNMQD